jgi:glycyl-tRNA synthetase
MTDNQTNLLEKIVSLCKRRGFIFPGSEIYGGLGGFYDFGPLGVELKFNIKQEWWNAVVRERERGDVVGLSAAIIMNPKAWEASGHVSGFSDPLVECGACNKRYRTDELVNLAHFEESVDGLIQFLKKRLDEEIKPTLKQVRAFADLIYGNSNKFTDEEIKKFSDIISKTLDDLEEKVKRTERAAIGAEYAGKFIGTFVEFYLRNRVNCPNCGKNNWTNLKQFNLMFKTFVGPAEDTASVAYLRPETAGGIFMNYRNVLDTTRVNVPFGIAQIGRAFRNEINAKDYIFRTREFEQMELEFFVRPDEADHYFKEWVDSRFEWYKRIGLKNVYKREQTKDERAHYSKATVDIEYKFPFGKKEIEGIANRGDFDLKTHQKHSGQDLSYFEQETNERFIPYVIEPSAGVDRIALAVLCDAYHEDGDRVILKLHPKLAPYKAAVFPLLKNKPELVKKAEEIYKSLKKEFNVAWDDRGNIGKRYYAQDEIGTPFCITVDFDTLGEKPELKDTVTIRHRDSAKQERVSASELKNIIEQALD